MARNARRSILKWKVSVDAFDDAFETGKNSIVFFFFSHSADIMPNDARVPNVAMRETVEPATHVRGCF